MKHLTLALLTTFVGTSAVLSFTSTANAESRYEYCRHHACDNHDRYFDRYHDRYYDRGICESHHRSCWYDRTARAWRYRE